MPEQNPFNSAPSGDNPFSGPGTPNPFSGAGAPASNPFNSAAAQNSREPQGFFGGVLDVLLRGNFASAKLANSLLDGEVIGAFTGAVRELIAPEERLSFSDIIAERAPDFTKSNPLAAATLGFAADIALDPFTYLTLGAGAGVRVVTQAGTRVLTKAGAKAFKGLAVKNAAAAGENLLKNADAIRLAEKQIATMIDSVPDLAEPIGRSLGFKIPFGKLVKTRPFREMTGLKPLFDRLAPLKKKSAVVQTFNDKLVRVKDLPQEWQAQIDQLQGAAEEFERQFGNAISAFGVSQNGLIRRASNSFATTKIGARLGFTVKIDGATRISRAAHEVADKVSLFESQGTAITSKQVEALRQAAIKTNELTTKEVGLWSFFRSTFADSREAEIEAGVLEAAISEYFPRVFKNVLSNPDDFLAIRRGIGKPDFAKARKFETVQEAVDLGYKLDENAVRVGALRVMAGKRAVLVKDLEAVKLRLLKDGTLQEGTAALRKVEDDIQRMGSSNVLSESTLINDIVGTVDFITQSVFKPSATVLKPSFLTFQISSNRVQRVLNEGLGKKQVIASAQGVFSSTRGMVRSIVRGQGFFDPASRQDAMHLLMNIDNPEALKGWKLQTGMGFSISGEEAAAMLKRNNLVQGAAIGGTNIGNGIEAALRRAARVERVSEATGLSRGHVSLASSAGAYWRFPQIAEDYAKATSFLNAIRLGHGERAAADVTRRSLFDYLNGLTSFEQKWAKRIAPFYSFQRFALPLGINTATTNPGRIANTTKGTKFFFEVWNKGLAPLLLGGKGETLNDAERHAVPGWILEQPSTFTKFGIDGRAIFNAFNNFTPLDVLNFIEPGPDGSVSFTRTVKKTILATLSPFLKVPGELMFNENFFTGRAIADAERFNKDRLGNKGDILGAMDAILPAAVKAAMGWEVGLDVRDGKEKVYINPWLSHVATSFVPILNQIINVADADQTTSDKVLRLLGNVSTFKVDLQQQANFKRKEGLRSIREERSRIRSRRSRGLDLNQSILDLQSTIQIFQEEAQQLSTQPIRGRAAASGDSPF